MSAITISRDLIHYEKLGRGRPVILIHGWIGSWRYWIPLMQKLHTQFSVYTLDLIGFGDSSKTEEHYTVDAQVKMLEQFMEQLAIPKAAMVGHGLGTMVVTEFALRNPDKIARLLLSSIPLFNPGNLNERIPAGTRKLLTPRDNRSSLAPSVEEVMGTGDQTLVNSGPNSDLTVVSGSSGIYTPFHELPTIGRPASENIDRDALRKAAEARDKAKKTNNHLKERFHNNSILNLLQKCFKDTEPEFDKLKQDVVKCDDKVLAKSVESFEAGEMLDNLRRITAPVIAVHGQDDPIIPVPKDEIWEYLTKEKEGFFVPFPLSNVRHFPMLEHDAFPRLMQDFLTKPSIDDIELRDKWIRKHH